MYGRIKAAAWRMALTSVWRDRDASAVIIGNVGGGGMCAMWRNGSINIQCL
jgi:hypothetical protein